MSSGSASNTSATKRSKSSSEIWTISPLCALDCGRSPSGQTRGVALVARVDDLLEHPLVCPGADRDGPGVRMVHVGGDEDDEADEQPQQARHEHVQARVRHV